MDQEEYQENINDFISFLKETGYDFQREVRVSSTSADLYVETPTSGSAIVEFKNWEPNEENVEFGRRFVEAQISASGVDHAFLVIPYTNYEEGYPGVVSFQSLQDQIVNLPSKETAHRRLSVTPENPKKTIFIAMPFDVKYIDTYIFAIELACSKIDAKPIRIDRESFVGDIPQKIRVGISHSRFMIADISESNPNVMYEIGVATGCKKEIIQICSTEYDEIPFDIRNDNTISYGIGSVSKLIPELTKHVKEIDSKISK